MPRRLSQALMALGVVVVVRCVVLAEDFPKRCDLPFDGIKSTHLSIDKGATGCGLDGKATGSDAQHAQNRMKNNFCAEGAAMTVTKAKLVQLQQDTKAHHISFGSDAALPDDRSGLASLGEGKRARLVGFVVNAHFSNVGKGESVNCKRHGQANNDIHIVVGESKTLSDECKSVTAEIPPHFRPAAWSPTNLNSITHPVRFTGQLFFDASHKACAGGTRSSPARASTWEIHPVYAIDVCKQAQRDQCAAGTESNWVPLDEWLGLEEEPSPADS